LRFRNTYQGTVYVAVRFQPDEACGGFEAIQGWWAIPADGKAVTVVSTHDRYARFYAKTANGDVTWAGNDGPYGVYLDQKFFVCEDRAKGTTSVKFRVVDLGPSGPHTVSLGPPR
jgi:uncharacterized membrane protein